MSEYRAPVREMMFVLNELAELNKISQLPGCEEATADLVESVLTEASQLAQDVIAPTNVIGDAQGTRVENKQVVVPEEFKAAYGQLVENGWCGVALDPEHGGMGLPYCVGMAVEEMWQSANLAWSLCMLLTMGAVRAVEAHGSDELKEKWLPKMVSGEWTGTMNLTEPQAGSDLAAIRSEARPDGDSWLVSGQKIFITWGDHDMTDNVVHLVLARTPDAPAGVKGLSLFLVPKNLVDDNGEITERNNVWPVSVEHKLGIHGSPTCVMAFEDARGWLVGTEGLGLMSMFVMMNHARISVGLEGVAISERALQQAVYYATDRVQGAAVGKEGKAAILHHPDVRRMLMTMRAETEAMRSLAYVTAAQLDIAERADDEAARKAADDRVGLLTPIVKGWSTETSQVLTSLGLQVHGGMGYVEETGAAQYLRDARITTIYEGTTGIQANDLVGRKVLRDGGAAMGSLIAEIRADLAAAAETDERVAAIAKSVGEGVDLLESSVTFLLENAASDPALPGAISSSLLMLTGTVTGGWQLARGAGVAAAKLNAGTAEEEFYSAKLITAQFYAEQISPRALGFAQAITAGTGSMMALTEEQLQTA